MGFGIQKNSLDLKNQAATKIQGMVRGKISRLKLDALKKQEFLCPIKHDSINFYNSTLTKCGHIFDRYSLSRWIDKETETKSSVACPSCRQNIVSVNTKLLLFARDGNVESIQHVVKQGANMKTNDSYGQTALHLAALEEHPQTVKALIDLGANLEAKNNGWTALHLASLEGHTETVKALIERGANLEVTNDNGWTALHIAAQFGHAETVIILAQALIYLGANLEAKNNKGSTALQIAIKTDHQDVVYVLKECGAKDPTCCTIS